MAILNNIKGLNFVLANMKKADIKSGMKVNRIVRGATLVLGRLSGQEVPVDQNNLRPSRFERVSGLGFNTKGKVGYTAPYAMFVHENLDAAHGDEFNAKHSAKIAAASSRGRDSSGRFTKGAKKQTFRNRGSGQKAKFLSDPMAALPRHPLFLALVKREALR